MVAAKTRCKKCVHANKLANQEPCNKCAEIHPAYKKFENEFLDSTKNLLKEEGI